MKKIFNKLIIIIMIFSFSTVIFATENSLNNNETTIENNKKTNEETKANETNTNETKAKEININETNANIEGTNISSRDAEIEQLFKEGKVTINEDGIIINKDGAHLEEDGQYYHSTKIYAPVYEVLRYNPLKGCVKESIETAPLKPFHLEPFLEPRALVYNNYYHVPGWKKYSGYLYLFDANGKLVTDLRNIITSPAYYLLAVNKTKNCLTVYAADPQGYYSMPVVSFVISVGDRTPVGLFSSGEKEKWKLMYNNIYTKYATRIVNHFLFHSCLYHSPNNYDFVPSSYNMLGTTASGGCVRMQAKDCHWIYENIPEGTPILVYESPIEGPFPKPTIERQLLPFETYDPTDPEVTEDAIKLFCKIPTTYSQIK